jgi:hypothetical protein
MWKILNFLFEIMSTWIIVLIFPCIGLYCCWYRAYIVDVIMGNAPSLLFILTISGAAGLLCCRRLKLV